MYSPNTPEDRAVFDEAMRLLPILQDALPEGVDGRAVIIASIASALGEIASVAESERLECLAWADRVWLHGINKAVEDFTSTAPEHSK